MGIEMIQDFCLETDDLNHMATILRTLLPIKMRKKGNRLYLIDSSSGWHEDGSEYCHDMKCITIGEKHHTVHTRSTYHGSSFMKIEETYDTPEEAARVASEYNKARKTKPMYQHVATIGGLYSGSEKPKDAIMMPGYEALIEAIIERLKKVDKRAFLDDHWHPIARLFDGTVTVGYRLTDARNYMNQLHVTFCHMFYGK
jgi:hypothetical protein